MALKIKKGENFIVRFDLKDKFGDPLSLGAGVVSIIAEIMQHGQVVETLTYPTTNLRQGEFISQAELEVIQATSNKFTKGDVTVRTTIIAEDPDFDTELEQKKITETLVAQVT